MPDKVWGKIKSIVEKWPDKVKKAVVLSLFIAALVICVLVGVLYCEINFGIVCLVMLVQVLLGILLDENPIWLHLTVVLIDLFVGILTNNVILMIFALLLYGAWISTLEAVDRINKEDKQSKDIE